MNGDNDLMNEESGWLDRLRESPRTVSALVVILIVAAAIYAFSGDDNKEVEDDLAGEVTLEEVVGEFEELEGEEVAEGEEGEMEDGEEEVAGEVAGETDHVAVVETPVATPTPLTPVSQQDLQAAAQAAPVEVVNNEYSVTAEAGDGVTHLARKATTAWLASNNAGYTVTNEHRIYIEDYIQNQIGRHGLAVGQAQTIGFDMIQEAVGAAGQLSETQLQNLSKYTPALM